MIEPAVFADDRGFLMETFNKGAFDSAVGQRVEFVQDNQSRSIRGVLRGLHYQRPPHEQAKLVRVVTGEIFDVAVDIRPNSATFGQWAGVTLSGENSKQLWIPQGFAHGFLVLSAFADVAYKLSGYYSPADECSISWKDETLAIDWPLEHEPLLSEKDAQAPGLAHASSFTERG